MKNPISEQMRKQAADLLKAADAIEKLYDDSKYHRGLAVRMAELVERQGLSYAEKTELKQLETPREDTADNDLVALPAG